VAPGVATALKELHEREIVHRDLKPQNVLSFRGEWKLADFGISKNVARLVTLRTFQQAGTLGYAAPEQFHGVEAHPKADLYSVGKLLVFLLTGQTDPDYARYPAWDKLIRRCLKPVPSQRPRIDQVIKSLKSIPT
jgi:eukaryotic-like serine/threonine-protein kinase